MSTDDLTLAGESRVVIAGDWHGSIRWIQTLIPRIHRAAPDVKTILQLGDFGFWKTGERDGKGFLGAIDYWAKQSGIERVLVTPGNHEDWGLLSEAFASNPNEPFRLSERSWALPRGYRFTLLEMTFLSFGGAASFDSDRRSAGIDWWAEELATEDEADRAASGPRADILLAHETIDHPSPRIVDEMSRNRDEASKEIQERTALSRSRVSQVYDYHEPQMLFHGHFHRPDMMTLPDGRQLWSLGMERQDRNVGILDLPARSFEWLFG